MKLLSTFLASIFIGFSVTGNPVGFIENVGQITDQHRSKRSDIHFSLQGGDMNVFISPGAIQYQFVRIRENEKKRPALSPEPFDINSLRPAEINTYRIEAELVGANKNVQPIKSGQLKYYERYYTPPFGEQGGMGHSYSKITYPNIYPNIDWVIYLNDGKVEYDFIIKEGGNPKDIQIKYGGSTSLNIDPAGDLHISCPLGTLTEHSPASFQTDGKTVGTSFSLENNIVSFNVARYSGTLLIDPYIEWATYYGGAVEDHGNGVTTDASRNVYMCGGTYSSSQIATSGAYDVTYADSVDGYIVKFDSNGTRLWATYYGGSAIDIFLKMAYDNHGNIVVCGTTDNTAGIATIGSDQPNFSGPNSPGNIWGGGGDAFLVKFDSTGNRVWGTYFGGDQPESPRSLVCDTGGNILMCGGANSLTNVATTGAYQNSIGGSGDCFLTKYSSGGQKIWSTYYGGNADDIADGVKISNNGNIYICGSTYSPSNIATTGTFQTVVSPARSGFIAKFDNSGNRVWGTYFGEPTNLTHLQQLCVDENENIFVGGHTRVAVNMTTVGCHQSVYGGSGNFSYGDVLIGKFDSTGNRIWSTYLGGSGDETVYGMSCNNANEVFLVGITTSSNNIATNAFQGNYGGGPYGLDGLFAKFSTTGSCVWSTYLGGTEDNWLKDLSVDDNGSFFVCGDGKTFPTTSGSHKPNNLGIDAYLAKFHDFPTGIASASSSDGKFIVYPNPAAGFIIVEGEIETSFKNTYIVISTIDGQQLYTQQFNDVGNRIFQKIQLANSLSAGVYILEIVSGNNAVTERLIIK